MPEIYAKRTIVLEEVQVKVWIELKVERLADSAFALHDTRRMCMEYRGRNAHVTLTS